MHQKIMLERVLRDVGMSQSELARRAEMNYTTVRLIASGRQTPWPGQRNKIVNALSEAGWQGEPDTLFTEASDHD